MALIKCGECGKEISSKAVACPNCGAPLQEVQPVTIRNPRRSSGCSIVMLILIVVFGSVYLVGRNSYNDYLDQPADQVALNLLPEIATFLSTNSDFGAATGTQPIPDWRFGKRQRVQFDTGRDLLFYVKDGAVMTVYEDTAASGRQIVWGEPLDLSDVQ